jgi:2-polyprenyl-3-methyl-5-hydroxy-6-metoxy-1,4-benzoquinol methylase
MSNYRDYGFNEAIPSHTQAYLSGPILNLLNPRVNKTVLDLGCGNGALSRFLLENGYNMYGVDASPSGIEIASKIYPERFSLMDFSIPTLPEFLNGKSFDTIISTEVLEHLYDPRSFIVLCKEILAPQGGEIIISTPYHGYLKNLMISILGKWDTHMNPLWDGGHIKMWSKNTLTALLEEQGFKVTAFHGCGRMPFFWKSMIIKAVLK